MPGCEGDWQSLANLQQSLAPFTRLAVDERGQVITGPLQQTLHMAHRLGGLATLLYLAVLAFRAVSIDGRFRGTAIGLVMLLVIQAALAVATVLMQLPLLLVTAHNAVAALLLLSVVNLNHLATPIRPAAD